MLMHLVDKPEPGPCICNVFRAWETGNCIQQVVRRGHSCWCYVEASELDYVLAELEFIFVDDYSIRLE